MSPDMSADALATINIRIDRLTSQSVLNRMWWTVLGQFRIFMRMSGNPRTNFECKACGGIVNYADDPSYTATCSDQQELAATLSSKYTVISEYLSANKLKVNDSKTHMMILTTSQLRRSQDINVQVQVGIGVQELCGVERLLGLQLHERLKFQGYIMGNEKSLIKMLNTRVKALQMVKKRLQISRLGGLLLTEY